MEMINIRTLLNRFSIDAPHCPSHPHQPRSRSSDGFDPDLVSHTIFRMRPHDGYFKTCTGERAAFFTEDSMIQWTMDRSHVNNASWAHWSSYESLQGR